jgi:hypothetical protein
MAILDDHDRFLQMKTTRNVSAVGIGVQLSMHTDFLVAGPKPLLSSFCNKHDSEPTF